MNENVNKFFELYNSDPALRARVQEAEVAYPGSLEIREALVKAVLLPVAEELGLGFTVEELRFYERSLWAQRQREEDADASEDDDDGDVYWLHNRGWSNDESRFCGDK